MLRWGISSTGRVNRHFVTAAAHVPEVEVGAVASRSASRAQAFATTHAIPRAHGSFDDLIHDDEIDAVYVSAPNSLHEAWTSAALDAGKHVLCEKPLSTSPTWTEEVFSKATASGLVVAEAFMYRYQPRTATICQLIGDGAIGEPRLARFSFCFPARHPSNARYRAALDGGALLDVGCYGVNLSRLLLGEPARVFAEWEVGPSGVDSNCLGLLRTSGGGLSAIEASIDLPYRRGVEVVGQAGSLLCPDPWSGRPSHVEVVHDGAVRRIESPVCDAHALQLRHVTASMLGRAEPLLGRQDAMAQAAALSALQQAARTGEVTEVAPVPEAVGG